MSKTLQCSVILVCADNIVVCMVSSVHVHVCVRYMCMYVYGICACMCMVYV